MKIIFTFLFLILVLQEQVVFSQVRRPILKPIVVTPTPRSAVDLTTKETICFSEKSLDAAANTLPSNYHGNNLRDLIYEMSKREKLAKDEFETTKQFVERIENEKKKNFLGELNSNSLFSFEIFDRNFKYDADNESMNAEISLSASIPWTSPCQNEESYLTSRTSYKLFVESLSNNSFPINLSFKINVERAKRAKPNLRILAIGKIKERDDKFYTEPLSDSYNIYRKQYALNFSLEEIWLYDSTTGEVFLKYKPNFGALREEAKKLSEIGGIEFLGVKNLYESGRDDEAITILRRKIASEPMDARAHFWLGKIYYRRKDFEQAASSLRTALFWGSNFIDAHILLGKVYLEKRDCSQAKNYSVSALEVDAENQEAKDLQRQTEKCSKY